MHDCIKPMRQKYCIECRGVANVALDQSSPAGAFAMTKQEVVEHDAVMPRGGERLGATTTNIAGTPGDKYSCHMCEKNYGEIINMPFFEHRCVCAQGLRG